jgi:hypothetical protein
MTVKGADWDRRLTRALLTPKGKRLRTLREAARFVADQRPAASIWLSAARALMFASMLPDAVEDATDAVEKAIATLGKRN